jgi:hypothetical protein
MATPTASSITEAVRTIADYMDQRSKQADVSPGVTLNKVYRDLHVVVGLLAELDEDSRALPTLYGARLVDAPENPDGDRYAVEVYDLGTRETVATSAPINYTVHISHALARINVGGDAFRIAGRGFRTAPGVFGLNYPVQRVKIV